MVGVIENNTQNKYKININLSINNGLFFLSITSNKSIPYFCTHPAIKNTRPQYHKYNPNY